MCQIMVFDEQAPTKVDEIEELISDSQLWNGDGTGIGWVENRMAHWQKGVKLTPDYLAHLITKLPRPVVVHTRIKTSGNKINALCHPFPASAANGVRGADPMGILFHNGIFTPWRSLAALLGVKINHNAWSDTKVLASAIRMVGWTRVIRAVKADGSDKLAILHPKWKNPLQLVGTFTRERGVLVSSAFWKMNVGGATYGNVWDRDEYLGGPSEGIDHDGVRYFTRGGRARRTELARLLEEDKRQDQRETVERIVDRYPNAAVWCQECQYHHPLHLCPKRQLTGE